MTTQLAIARVRLRGIWVILAAAFCVSVSTWRSVSADDAAESRQERELATRRLEVMRERIAAATIRSRETNFPAKFSEKPLFRYSDHDRGYLAAAVWKLGDAGRPKAFLITELIPKPEDRLFISYEYISLTDTPFDLRSGDMNWSPDSTLVDFKPIPDVPAPMKTPALRLRQLREIARRFTGSEIDKNEKCELRLLPQPIGRYQPGSENTDAAIFILAYGTNPELMLLIETEGNGWAFGVSRMSGAEEISLKFDDKQVWQGPPVVPGETSPYTGTVSLIQKTGLLKDDTSRN
jgi:hypothetical protein